MVVAVCPKAAGRFSARTMAADKVVAVAMVTVHRVASVLLRVRDEAEEVHCGDYRENPKPGGKFAPPRRPLSGRERAYHLTRIRRKYIFKGADFYIYHDAIWESGGHKGGHC